MVITLKCSALNENTFRQTLFMINLPCLLQTKTWDYNICTSLNMQVSSRCIGGVACMSKIGRDPMHPGIFEKIWNFSIGKFQVWKYTQFDVKLRILCKNLEKQCCLLTIELFLWNFAHKHLKCNFPPKSTPTNLCTIQQISV